MEEKEWATAFSTFKRFSRYTIHRLLVVLLSFLTLSSCFMPDQFSALISIDKNGEVALAYHGELIFVPGLFEGRNADASDEAKYADIADRLNDTSGFRDASYEGDARFKVGYQKSQRIDSAIIFPPAEILGDPASSSFRIRRQEDNIVHISTIKIRDRELKQLEQLGVRPVGRLRVITDRKVLRHNADEISGDTYTWNIDGLGDAVYLDLDLAAEPEETAGSDRTSDLADCSNGAECRGDLDSGRRFSVASLAGMPINGQGVLTGTVVDNFGHPLEGASVKIVGSAIESVTDAGGAYELPYVPGEFEVTISLAGHDAETFALNLAAAAKYPVEQKQVLRLPLSNGIFYWGKADWKAINSCRMYKAQSDNLTFSQDGVTSYAVQGSPTHIIADEESYFIDTSGAKKPFIFPVTEGGEVLRFEREGGWGGWMKMPNITDMAETGLPAGWSQLQNMSAAPRWGEVGSGRKVFYKDFQPGTYAYISLPPRSGTLCYTFEIVAPESAGQRQKAGQTQGDAGSPAAQSKPEDVPQKPANDDAFAAVLQSVSKLDRAAASHQEQKSREQLAAGHGQTTSRNEVDVPEPITGSELKALLRQISACWTLPAGVNGIEAMVIKLRIEVRPDRTVQRVTVIEGTSAQNIYGYQIVADSAKRAVERCSPLNLPATKKTQWSDMILNLRPAANLNEPHLILPFAANP